MTVSAVVVVVLLSTTVYLIFMEVLLARNFRKDVGQYGSWFSHTFK